VRMIACTCAQALPRDGQEVAAACSEAQTDALCAFVHRIAQAEDCCNDCQKQRDLSAAWECTQQRSGWPATLARGTRRSGCHVRAWRHAAADSVRWTAGAVTALVRDGPQRDVAAKRTLLSVISTSGATAPRRLCAASGASDTPRRSFATSQSSRAARSDVRDAWLRREHRAPVAAAAPRRSCAGSTARATSSGSTTTLLDGRATSAAWLEELRAPVATVSRALGRPPSLTVIVVGNRADSAVYVAKKEEACAQARMQPCARVSQMLHRDATALLFNLGCTPASVAALR
jgi:Tetrahydrofolate dehydrogenase/cyclohydrolase, catalytic domain